MRPLDSTLRATEISGTADKKRNLTGGNHNPGARRLADQHDAEHATRTAAGARLNAAKYGNRDRARD